MYKIYALLCPISNNIEYVGKTYKELRIRLNEHVYESRKKKLNKRTAWIKSLTSQGLRPKIILIDCTECPIKINELEIFYIAKYKKENINLKNDQPGGNGQPKGFKFKNRYVPEKGVQPEHFKKFNSRPRDKWSENQRIKFSNSRKGVRVKGIEVDVIDLISGERFAFKSIRAAANFLEKDVSEIVGKYKDRHKVFRNRYVVVEKNCKAPINIIKYRKPILQHRSDGAVIKYDSILQASKDLKISRNTINYCLKHGSIDRRGNRWKYEC